MVLEVYEGGMTVGPPPPFCRFLLTEPVRRNRTNPQSAGRKLGWQRAGLVSSTDRKANSFDSHVGTGRTSSGSSDACETVCWIPWRTYVNDAPGCALR